MVKTISKKIINSIAKSTRDKYNEDELEQMEYALVTILFESIKIISTIVIFSLFGYFKEIIIIQIILCSVKPFIGGYHEETQIKCFLTTLLSVTGILILSMQCTLSFIANFILIFLSIFCIWNQAPVINSKMPITRPEIINKNRRTGLRNVTIIGFVSIVTYNYSNYYLIITWTILLLALEMFNKREN
ncbi:accessory gene regulator B family protein [Clostridium sp. C2-6-12]|uniref:accessory gene regulator ArgB-like protein n=1 Tax=Clostridium sp. C2-6-12 TaxID=2698832 RepID=UPI00136E8B01|nr:accessory gene regulator B family protein [Clostridium sp. C2-6-12]